MAHNYVELTKVPDGPPRLMGIVNVTPDSFSDGGKFFTPESAVQQALNLQSAGAEILDFGAESTRPGAVALTASQEMDRLLPALNSYFDQAQQRAIISVDTYHAETAVAAIQTGAQVINDISGGLYDPDMGAAVGDLGCPYICQHLRGVPGTMDQFTNYNGNVIEGVYAELSERTETLLKAGMKSEQIIWDPGLGFAKNPAQNWQLVLAGQKLSRVGFPVLIGPSRKRFLASPPAWLAIENMKLWAAQQAAAAGVEILFDEELPRAVWAEDASRSEVAYQTVADSSLQKSVEVKPQNDLSTPLGRDPLTAQIAAYLASHWGQIWGIRVHEVAKSQKTIEQTVREEQ